MRPTRLALATAFCFAATLAQAACLRFIVTSRRSATTAEGFLSRR
jgi:hypothetical protein